ncbi:MAG: hypothetical protein IJ711_09460 [Lachnospiraceae bacterium]|nr:hypothetical protein [Lachnospiraceae bacterium]
MRITPNMLWSARSTGTSIRSNALLSQMGRSRVGKSNTIPGSSYSFSSIYAKQAAGYANMGNASEKLRSTAAAFASKNTNNLFAAARKSGSAANLLRQAKDMVSSYNATVKNLKNTPSALNDSYRQMMENAFRENSDDLKKIGITVNRDKSVSIDEKKFASAGIDTVEQVLGSGFSSRLEFVSGNIANYAIANASGTGLQYGAGLSYGMGLQYGAGNQYGTGSNYLASMLMNRYNFWM